MPDFKLTTNHGREPLIEPANLGPHKDRYFEGWVSAAKKAKGLGGCLTVSPEAPVTLWARYGDGRVEVIKDTIE